MLFKKTQDVFIIPDGSAGALAELERRKFTAEEGVNNSFIYISVYAKLLAAMQDHLTLLNGGYLELTPILSAYVFPQPIMRL